jgi:4-oxalocrotonate tautomerase
MPFVTIDYPKSAPVSARRQLQEGLAKVVLETLLVSVNNVRIYTRQIDQEDVYLANDQHDQGLPIIRVEFLEGRTPDQKRALVHGLAHAAADVLGVSVLQIRTILFERQATEWARGDRMVSEA